MNDTYFKIDNDRHIVYGVTTLGMEQESLAIPEGIVKIEPGAFHKCALLEDIIFPKSLKEIGNSAFLNCTSLRKITFLGSVEKIYQYAFSNCEMLSDVVLPPGLRTIGDKAFSGCKSLTSVVIPSSVEDFGRTMHETADQNSFMDCDNLSSLVVEEGNKNYRSIDNVVYETEYNSITCVPAGLKLKSYQIVDGTVDIADYAFAGNSMLETVVMPASLTCIGYGAFANCTALTHIDLSNVTHIFEGAFNGCHSLNETARKKANQLIEKYRQSIY